jgi:hypothetical protein
MTLEHLNYCRQIRKQFGEMLRIPSMKGEPAQGVRHLIDLCEASQKFSLPPGGVFLMDPELRAIDDSTPMQLPYQFIALEYSVPGVYPSKRVLFVREVDGYMEGDCVAWLDHAGVWANSGSFEIPVVNYLDRANKNIDGGPSILMYQEAPEGEECRGREPLVLLHFLNALACSNVSVERSDPKNSGRKIKSALPFDTYHVLTIDVPGRPGERTGAGGDHRSPREHLRRGHIRRLADGRRVWVNATVVSAGSGGAVKKDYALRRAA